MKITNIAGGLVCGGFFLGIVGGMMFRLFFIG